METVVLASASPRRSQLLAQADIPFEIQISGADERVPADLSAPEAVEAVAARKAAAVAVRFPGRLVVAADTVVALSGRRFGKPASRGEAREMLRALSGKTHTVYTGVALLRDERLHCFCEATEVTFYSLTAEEIAAYVESGEPMDKAGAYGIQGRGALLVAGIKGDYNNVVGLPVSRLVREMAAFTDNE